MARHYNRVILIGNLTREPELRYTPNNTAVTDLGLAVNRNYQDGSGEWQEDTAFVDVTVWGRQAENASQYLDKGSRVFIEGRLTFDQWENDAGENRSKLSVTAEKVEFLDSAEQSDGPESGAPGGDSPDEILDDVDVEETEDDIPF
jgi:single-strand DNA-binding protein